MDLFGLCKENLANSGGNTIVTAAFLLMIIFNRYNPMMIMTFILDI
nr:MAG TPA: hypothetical protein [Caudoviricetes sp.]